MLHRVWQARLASSDIFAMQGTIQPVGGTISSQRGTTYVKTGLWGILSHSLQATEAVWSGEEGRVVENTAE
jgi:hypothetical protein